MLEIPLALLMEWLFLLSGLSEAQRRAVDKAWAKAAQEGAGPRRWAKVVGPMTAAIATIVASSRQMGKEISEGIGQRTGYYFEVADAGRDLGVQTTVGRRRRTKLQQSRRMKGKARLIRIKGLVRAVKGCRRMIAKRPSHR